MMMRHHWHAGCAAHTSEVAGEHRDDDGTRFEHESDQYSTEGQGRVSVIGEIRLGMILHFS